MYFNVPLCYFVNIVFFSRVFSSCSFIPRAGVKYEYNVVVGLFKLQHAIYLHGDLKEKAYIFKDMHGTHRIHRAHNEKGIAISLFSGSPFVSPAYYPVGQPELQDFPLPLTLRRHDDDIDT
jgi:hypothetical protein